MHVLYFGSKLNPLQCKPLQGTAGAGPGTEAGSGAGAEPGAALPEAAARAEPRPGSAVALPGPSH